MNFFKQDSHSRFIPLEDKIILDFKKLEAHLDTMEKSFIEQDKRCKEVEAQCVELRNMLQKVYKHAEDLVEKMGRLEERLEKYENLYGK